MRIRVTALTTTRHHAQIRPHISIAAKALRVRNRQHKRQRCDGTDTVDLPKKSGYRVVLVRYLRNRFVYRLDLRCECVNRRHQGQEFAAQRGRQLVLQQMKRRGALRGQAAPNQFHGAANVIHQHRPTPHQRVTRTNRPHVNLMLATPVRHR